jgi:hypothetical protein
MPSSRTLRDARGYTIDEGQSILAWIFVQTSWKELDVHSGLLVSCFD